MHTTILVRENSGTYKARNAAQDLVGLSCMRFESVEIALRSWDGGRNRMLVGHHQYAERAVEGLPVRRFWDFSGTIAAHHKLHPCSSDLFLSRALDFFDSATGRENSSAAVINEKQDQL